MKKYLLIPVILLGLVSQAFGASSHVQSAGERFFTSDTVTATWGGATTAHNVIACYVWWSDATSTLSGVADTVNGSLTDSGLGVQRLNSAHSAQMFYKEDIAGGAASDITATLGGGATPSVFAMSCSEISGRATAGALDQKKWNTQNFLGTGTDFITSGSVTTTTNGQYIFGATRAQFGTDATAGTTPSYILTSPGTDNHVIAERLTDDQASAGSIAAVFTPSGNDGYITGIMTFKASGGAPPAATPKDLTLLGVGR